LLANWFVLNLNQAELHS